MTDTSKPESVKLDEFKSKYISKNPEDLRDKKYLSKRRKERRTPKNILDNIDLEKIEIKPGKVYIMSDNSEFKAKGGRVGLRGGGICKKGMNKKAIGKNS